MTNLPSYDELPVLESGQRSGWGIFGKDDNLGLMNLVTPERVASAARLVRRGALFPLDCAVNEFAPSANGGRGMPRQQIIHRPGTAGFDDVVDNLYLQGSSQWDSLAHAGFAPDAFYNGATEADILNRSRNGIEHWANHGVAGRAVLLDMVKLFANEGRYYDPSKCVYFTVEDLERAREMAGFEYQTGDFLLIHTGYVEWFLGLDEQARRAHFTQSKDGMGEFPGLIQNEEMVRYLWDVHVAAVIVDNVPVEAWPKATPSGPFQMLHPLLIGLFGMALGELWWLKDLATDCAQDGVYESFIVACPINLPGGIGSPANAVAIK